MKAMVDRISASPRYARVVHWGKLITFTGGAQAIVQGTGLICGILVIRLLPKQEYAWYTIANTMLGTMSLLGDSGISTGVMAQGGKVWQNREKLGTVLATGFDLRRKFAIISLLIAVPILIYLLLYHGAGWLIIILIIASLIPAFFAALSDSLLEIIPKLHQDISSLQKNQVIVNTGRLILSCLTLFLFPFTFVAILSNSIPRAIGNRGLLKIAIKYANVQQKPDFEIKINILKVVRRILPVAVYYCLSGQITIWLISAFGDTASVAGIGALGRLSIVLNFISVFLATLIVPRFARLENNKSILLKRFLQIVGTIVLLCSCIIGLTWLFPNQILLILGKDYSKLGVQLLLSILGSCFSLLGGAIFSLYSGRGWIMNPILSISVSIASILIGLFLFRVSTMNGVLMLNIFVAFVQFILQGLYGLIKIINLPKSSLI